MLCYPILFWAHNGEFHFLEMASPKGTTKSDVYTLGFLSNLRVSKRALKQLPRDSIFRSCTIKKNKQTTTKKVVTNQFEELRLLDVNMQTP